jgi:hypothetical protein
MAIMSPTNADTSASLSSFISSPRKKFFHLVWYIVLLFVVRNASIIRYSKSVGGGTQWRS